MPVLYHNFAARTQRWKLLHASGFGNETFEGEAEYTFELVSIDKGELRLLATLTTGTESKGPWQVDVFLR